MSIPELRTVRVTKPKSAGKHFPEARKTFEAGLSRHALSNQTFPHREVLDKSGFVSRVIEGRDSDEKCAVPSSAPNAADLRGPDARDAKGYVIMRAEDHSVGAEWQVDSKTGARSKRYLGDNGHVVSPRRVRTVADGDSLLPGIKAAEVRRDGQREKAQKASKGRGVSAGQPKMRGGKVDQWADLREFASSHGIPLEKLADKRVRAAIRELITHREQVAAYAAK